MGAPIVGGGGGTLSDDDICRFSETGYSEAFIRYCVALRIADLVEQGIQNLD